MHPPLGKPHPGCQHVIDAFLRCAESQTFLQRCFGSCNDAKVALDQCFLREKKIKRKKALEKARAFDKRWRKNYEEMKSGTTEGK